MPEFLTYVKGIIASIIIILACSVYIILDACMELEKVYQGCELMLCVS